MSIRFKFKSSLNFDVLDIGNRASISVRELREKILHGNVSQQRQLGFDLIFSDEASGFEYKGDDSAIPTGSNVIVKRVPAEILPSALYPVQPVKDFGMKESKNQNPANATLNALDFGSDLLAMADSKFPDFSLEFDDNFGQAKNKDAAVFRNLDSPVLSGLERQKSDSADVIEAAKRGLYHSGNEMSTLHGGASNQMKSNNLPAEKSIHLPFELKCSICENFFKEAVMIPCCQHSFCETCICKVLIEKRRCPKCLSIKCGVQDLLPNLSLRQAIEHFLESQMLDGASENAMQKYVPDGESHIQSKDGLAYQQQKVDKLDGWEGTYPPHGMRTRPQDFNPPTEFQGENHVVSQVNAPDEAHSHTDRTGRVAINSEGGDRNFMVVSGPRKGVRNCYGCGSTDHLVRDCPIVNMNPVFHPGNGMIRGGMPGYAPPFWNGPSMPIFSAYSNMYGNPAMMHFNASLTPAVPFGVSPYMASMHGGLPGPAGDMRMGVGPSFHHEHPGLQQCDTKRQYSDEDVKSEKLSENKNETQKDKEASLSYSGNCLPRRSGTKNRNDKYVDERYPKGTGTEKGLSRAERSYPEKEYYSGDVDFKSDEKHSHHHGVSKKNYEKRGHYDSDCSLDHRSTPKITAKRDHSDGGSHKKHHNSSESGYKDRDSNIDETRHREKQSEYKDRSKRSHGSDEDRDLRGEYRSHKRRAY